MFPPNVSKTDAPRGLPPAAEHGKVGAVGPGSFDLCPCCGFRTGCTTCPVCFWTDVGRVVPDTADVPSSNSPSLSEAQLNFAIYGASHPRYREFVRAPRWDEVP